MYSGLWPVIRHNLPKEYPMTKNKKRVSFWDLEIVFWDLTRSIRNLLTETFKPELNPPNPL